MMQDLATNYTGAAIFWTYIAGALSLTAIIIRTIITSHQQNGRQNIPPALIALAVLSFSTLSYHMLNVLVLSYSQWTIQHHATLSLASAIHQLQVWKWSITSSLFQDFGEAIVADKSRYLLSSLGLLTTFRVASYMGIEGRRRNIPNLWAFFVLLEILPTSFAQTLFYMMLCTLPRPTGPQAKLKYWPVWVLSSLAYILCLNIAPSYTGSRLIYIILAARLLLLLPFFLPLQSPTPAQQPTPSQLAAEELRLNPKDTPGTLYLFQFTTAITYTFNYIMTMDWKAGVVPIVWEAVQSHPAVRTLGFDAVYSLAAFAYWLGRDEQVQQALEDDLETDKENDVPPRVAKAAKNRRDKKRA